MIRRAICQGQRGHNVVASSFLLLLAVACLIHLGATVSARLVVAAVGGGGVWGCLALYAAVMNKPERVQAHNSDSSNGYRLFSSGTLLRN